MSGLVLAFKATASGDVRKCEPFVEITDCVSCGHFGQHSITYVEGGFAGRACAECGFEWKQFAP